MGISTGRQGSAVGASANGTGSTVAGSTTHDSTWTPDTLGAGDARDCHDDISYASTSRKKMIKKLMKNKCWMPDRRYFCQIF
jgi:hypothetical protein